MERKRTMIPARFQQCTSTSARRRTRVNLTGIPSGTSVTIYAGSGTNTVTIAPTAGSLANLAGSLKIIGAGTTDLIVDDSLDAVGETYTLTDSTLASTGSGTIGYSNLNTLTLKAGTHADVINIRSTTPGTITTVAGGGGSDAIYVTSAPVPGSLSASPAHSPFRATTRQHSSRTIPGTPPEEAALFRTRRSSASA